MERSRMSPPPQKGQHLERLEARVHLDRLQEQVAVHWRCPYCHANLIENLLASECSTCGTMHHVSCFAENRGCSIHGCESHRAHSVRVGTSLRANTKILPCSHCTKAVDPAGLVARCACGRINHPLCFEVVGRCTHPLCASNVELMSYSEVLAIGVRSNAAVFSVMGWLLFAIAIVLVVSALVVHGADSNLGIGLGMATLLAATFATILLAAGSRANQEARRLAATPPPTRGSGSTRRSAGSPEGNGGKA